MTSRDPALQALLDRQAITQQITNYARSMDRLDREIGKAVFHPEARVDYGPMFQGTGWEFIDWIMESHLGFLAHSHQFSNITVRLEGDVAHSETYGDVNLRQERDGALFDYRNLGRYIDRWEKRDDAWRIIARSYVHDFDSITPVASSMFPVAGRRDRTDLSYFGAPAR